MGTVRQGTVPFEFTNMRLNKYIASCGIASRREADKLIESGRIMVNGTMPSAGQDISDSDKVTFDGKEISPLDDHIYLAYYKPVGTVCTRDDPHAERTIYDDILLDNRNITYAGRLDKDSEGLLILTDDGDLINAMMKGSNAHEKEYVVKVDKKITDDFLMKMADGIYLKDLDKTTRKCKVTRISDYSFNIILTQGMNRQIRRMCAECGYKVESLMRIRVMNILLSRHRLMPGLYENLTDTEIEELKADLGL